MVWSKVIKINGYESQEDGLSTESVVVGHETQVDRGAPIRQAAPCCAFTVKGVMVGRVRRVLGGAGWNPSSGCRRLPVIWEDGMALASRLAGRPAGGSG